MPLNTEREKIAHLLRRAGFGYGRAELDAAVIRGRDAVLEDLLNPERVSDPAESQYPSSAISYDQPAYLPLWWLLRMLTTTRPLQEKMTLFWHGHLTSSIRKTNQLRFTIINQNEFYRRNALGSFRELILGASKDPAMILYLDNNTNRRGRPNENYARELFELFTLGRDRGYTESDIRESARAFTGWFQRDGAFQFVAAQHDNGQKTIFNRTGNWDGTDVCEMAVAHPSTGSYLAAKLWSFFAYEHPEPEIVDALAEEYFRSRYEIRAVLLALFTHPAFYSDKAYRSLIKSPTELVAGFFRSLNAHPGGITDDIRLQLARALAAVATATGQVLFDPPDVAGWPGGADWVSTSSLLSRYNFAATAARDGYPGITTDIAGMLASHNLSTPPHIVDYFADLMLDNDITTNQRDALVDYLSRNDDGASNTFTLNPATINKKVRGLIHLIATTPQYQLV